MDISVSGHKMNVGEALTEHAQDRLATISEKFFSRSIDAKSTFTKIGHLFHVDISMHPNQGINLQARADADDPYAAFEAAADRVEKQLRRYKRRLKNHHNAAHREVVVQLGRETVFRPEPEDAPDGPDGPEGPEGHVNGAADGSPADDASDQPLIIAETETRIPTVSVSDAVMLMDLAGTDALMFKNSKTGGHEVVFRRSDGNIGWISPKD